MMRVRYAKIGIVLGIVVAAACGPLNRQQVEQQGWHNFQTAVADKSRDYDIYWLGREFDGGGEVLHGPDAGSPGPGEVDSVDGGLSMSYQADESRGQWASVDLTLYSREGWERLQDVRRRGAQARLEVKQVDIHGWPAEFKTNYYRPGYIAARILVVDRGNTFIEITTGSMVPATPGPEPNPLIDETTFLSAMQNLRAYPD